MTTAAPSGGRSGPGGSGRGRTLGFVLVVLVAFVVIGLLAANHQSSVAYDPASTSKTGTRAFVETLEHFGATVEVADTFPPPDTDVAVLFVDAVPPGRLDDVRAWVRAGHTLVVTAPESELAADGASGSGPHTSGNEFVDQGLCTVDALRGVDRLDRGRVGSFIDAFRVPADGTSCFGDADAALLVVQPLGQGRVVSIAGGALFQNQYLAEQDNALLARSLFAPRDTYRVAIVGDQAFGGSGDEGDEGPGGSVVSLTKLITLGATLAVLQLLVAVVVYAFARGRRLGRPVAEPQPVQIAGSELVEAVGNLLLQMKQPGSASAVLRADLRRELCGRLGLAPDTPPDLIAATIAARTSIDQDTALRALADYPLTSDDDLVALATQLDTIREEVLHGHAP